MKKLKKSRVFANINGHKVYESDFIKDFTCTNLEKLCRLQKQLQCEILSRELRMTFQEWEVDEKIQFYVYVMYSWRRVNHEKEFLISASGQNHDLLVEMGNVYLSYFDKLGLDSLYEIEDDIF